MREKERESNTDVREKHGSQMCSLPETQPAARACARTGNGTGNLSLCGTAPSQLSHTCQGENQDVCAFQKGWTWLLEQPREHSGLGNLTSSCRLAKPLRSPLHPGFDPSSLDFPWPLLAVPGL